MPAEFPTESQRRTLWLALTGVALAVIGALVVGLVVLLGNILNYLQPVLVPLAVAGILAYLLNPIVGKLQEKGLSRMRSIIYVFALCTVFLALAASLVLPKLVQQTGNLIDQREEIGEKLVRNLRTTPWLRPVLNQALARHRQFETDSPGTATRFPPPVEDTEFAKWVEEFPGWMPGTYAVQRDTVPFGRTNLGVWIAENGRGIFKTSTEWLNASAGKVFGFIGYSLGFLLVPVYLFFFLKETDTIQRRWKLFVPLKKSHLKTEVVETLGEMNTYLIAFFRGQVLVSIIDGILTGILLWLIGLPYAIVIGIALAILGVMPFVGFLVTLIPALLIAAATWGDWQHPLLVFLIFFLVQQIDGLLIQPKIIGDKVGLHPMTIIFSIFFWSLVLGGFLGALLAVPLSASVKVVFTRYIWDPADLDVPEECAEPAEESPPPDQPDSA